MEVLPAASDTAVGVTVRNGVTYEILEEDGALKVRVKKK
jgi:hypothetical protein